MLTNEGLPSGHNLFSGFNLELLRLRYWMSKFDKLGVTPTQLIRSQYLSTNGEASDHILLSDLDLEPPGLKYLMSKLDLSGYQESPWLTKELCQRFHNSSTSV